MKRIARLLPIVVLAANAAGLHADALDRKQVAADAAWVLHLDGDAFQKSQIGDAVLRLVLDPKSAQVKSDLKRELDFTLDWRQIQSLTAYGVNLKPMGTPDPSAVLLVQTTMDVQAGLDAAITKSVPTLQVKKVEPAAQPTYMINNDAWVGFAPHRVILLAKTREAIDKGRAVLTGASPSLAASASLVGYPDAQAPVLFLALAEGFAQQADLPPKAAILKQALGARLAVAESGNQVRLGLAIRTTSAEVASQIQEVARGLMALAFLSGNQDPSLQQLAKSANVTSEGALVNVTAAIPVSEVIGKLENAP